MEANSCKIEDDNANRKQQQQNDSAASIIDNGNENRQDSSNCYDIIVPISVACQEERADDGTCSRSNIECISWCQLDARTGELVMKRKAHKLHPDKPNALAKAIKQVDKSIGNKRCLLVTCGSLPLRQHLHPAALRAKVDLAAHYDRYADLIKEFNRRYGQPQRSAASSTLVSQLANNHHHQQPTWQHTYEGGPNSSPSKSPLPVSFSAASCASSASSSASSSSSSASTSSAYASLDCNGSATSGSGAGFSSGCGEGDCCTEAAAAAAAEADNPEHTQHPVAPSYCYCCDYYATAAPEFIPTNNGQLQQPIPPPSMMMMMNTSHPFYSPHMDVRATAAASQQGQFDQAPQLHQQPSQQNTVMIHPNGSAQFNQQELQTQGEQGQEQEQDRQAPAPQEKQLQQVGNRDLVVSLKLATAAGYPAALAAGCSQAAANASQVEEMLKSLSINESEFLQEKSLNLLSLPAEGCELELKLEHEFGAINCEKSHLNGHKTGAEAETSANKEDEEEDEQKGASLTAEVALTGPKQRQDNPSAGETNDDDNNNNAQLSNCDGVQEHLQQQQQQQDAMITPKVHCSACSVLMSIRLIDAMRLIIGRMINEGHQFNRFEGIKRRVEVGLCDASCRDYEQKVVRARGLPWQATEQDIANFFVGLNIARGGVGLCLSRQGRRNGEALIQFESREHRNLALSRHKHFMGTRYIEVYRANSEDFLNLASGHNNNNKAQPFLSRGAQVIVRMRGLPFTCTTKQVLDFFNNNNQQQQQACEVLGQEEGVLFVKNQDDKPTGDAFVLFANEDNASRALQKHKQNIGSRYVELFRSTISEVQQVLSISNSGCMDGGSNQTNGMLGMATSARSNSNSPATLQPNGSKQTLRPPGQPTAKPAAAAAVVANGGISLPRPSNGIITYAQVAHGQSAHNQSPTTTKTLPSDESQQPEATGDELNGCHKQQQQKQVTNLVATENSSSSANGSGGAALASNQTGTTGLQDTSSTTSSSASSTSDNNSLNSSCDSGSNTSGGDGGGGRNLLASDGRSKSTADSPSDQLLLSSSTSTTAQSPISITSATSSGPSSYKSSAQFGSNNQSHSNHHHHHNQSRHLSGSNQSQQRSNNYHNNNNNANHYNNNYQRNNQQHHSHYYHHQPQHYASGPYHYMPAHPVAPVVAGGSPQAQMQQAPHTIYAPSHYHHHHQPTSGHHHNQHQQRAGQYQLHPLAAYHHHHPNHQAMHLNPYGPPSQPDPHHPMGAVYPPSHLFPFYPPPAHLFPFYPPPPPPPSTHQLHPAAAQPPPPTQLPPPAYDNTKGANNQQQQPLIPPVTQRQQAVNITTPTNPTSYHHLHHHHQQAASHKRDCIRLRGLPFEAQVEDVLYFLGEQSKHIVYQGVHMVYSAQGQPTGEAIIQMNSCQSASMASQEFHKKVMSVGKKQRYIEVISCSIDDMMNLVLGVGFVGHQSAQPATPLAAGAAPATAPALAATTFPPVHQFPAHHFRQQRPPLYPSSTQHQPHVSPMASESPKGADAASPVPAHETATDEMVAASRDQPLQQQQQQQQKQQISLKAQTLDPGVAAEQPTVDSSR